MSENINYFNIFKKAWEITWRNRYLWWFGLLIALGGGGFNFNYGLNNGEWKKDEKTFRVLSDFFQQFSGWIIAGASLIFIFIIILAVIRIISRAGLISSIDNIQNNRKSSFKAGFKKGINCFWKIFLSSLVVNLFVLGVFLILLLPAVYLFLIKSFILGTITSACAIFIFIPIVILACFIRKYSHFYIVISELSVMSALDSAYRLFKKNIYSSAVMALLFLPIGIILAAAMLALFFSLGLFLLAIGMLFYAAFSKIGVFIVAALGVLVLIAIFLAMSSVYQVFFHAAWILFFKEISLVKTEEIPVVEEELVEKKLPSPEGVQS